MLGKDTLMRFLAFFGVTDVEDRRRRKRQSRHARRSRGSHTPKYDGLWDKTRSRPDPAVLARTQRVAQVTLLREEKARKTELRRAIRLGRPVRLKPIVAPVVCHAA